jgi:hypothetical protein
VSREASPEAALVQRHRAAGAVMGGAGSGLPLAFGAGEGAVAAEHAAARSAWALTDLGDRGLLEATGPLRQKLLHDVLSNDVELPAGRGSRAALMDVKGHLQALLRVSVAGDRVVLEVPAERLDTVEEALVRYRVGAPVRFARPDLAVLGVLGPEAAERLAALGLPAPAEGAESHAAGRLGETEVRVIRAGDMPAAGLVLHVARDGVAAVWERLVEAGARPLGRRALDVLRIEDGRPWYGPDVGFENLLHETGLLTELHSFGKGCYVGQEVVARLEGRGGHVNRQLRGLRLGAPATAGDGIERDGKPVGSVTTAGVSPAHGPVAMAYLHRSCFDPGTRVSVAGRPAEVTPLPLPASPPAA